jgi:hypothetical protein
VSSAGGWWFTPVLLATQQAEIRRILVQSQNRQVVLWDPISKKPITIRAGGETQGVGPEFKPHYWKKNLWFLWNKLMLAKPAYPEMHKGATWHLLRSCAPTVHAHHRWTSQALIYSVYIVFKNQNISYETLIFRISWQNNRRSKGLAL